MAERTWLTVLVHPDQVSQVASALGGPEEDAGASEDGADGLRELHWYEVANGGYAELRNLAADGLNLVGWMGSIEGEPPFAFCTRAGRRVLNWVESNFDCTRYYVQASQDGLIEQESLDNLRTFIERRAETLRIMTTDPLEEVNLTSEPDEVVEASA